MARKFLTALDMGKNQFITPVIENLAGAPSSPVKGQLYMNTTDNILYWWNGSGWVAAQGGAGAVPATTVTTSAVADAGVVGVATTYAREDHKHAREAFGTIGASTSFGQALAQGSAVTLARSDHLHGTPAHDAAAHSAIKISDLAVPTAAVSFNSQKITSLGTPTAGTDATTKDYVDNLTAGLSWKESVRAATTANGTMASAFQNAAVIDGVTLATGNRILLKNQTTTTENGIYTVNASGAPTRATDADAVGELEGAAVFVQEGTAQADQAWVCTTNAPITPGSTGTAWVQFGAGTAITAGAGLTGTTTFDIVATQRLDRRSCQRHRVGYAGTGGLNGSAVTAARSDHSHAAATDTSSGLVELATSIEAAAGTDTTRAVTPNGLAFALSGGTFPYARKYANASVGGATSQVITHNLDTLYCSVSVFRNSGAADEVDCDVEHTSVNTVTLRFATAPASNEYSVAIIG